MKEENDEILIDRIKANDISSYEILFRKYYKILYRFVYSYLNDGVIAEDITQEIFLYLWEKRHDIVIRTTCKTYLYAAVRNKCSNYIKTELSKRKLSTDINEALLTVSSNEEDEQKQEQIKRQIKKAIDALPNKCQQIFLLSRNEGMTYEEIANELNLSKKTVENQMGIALKKLRENLKITYLYFKNN